MRRRIDDSLKRRSHSPCPLQASMLELAVRCGVSSQSSRIGSPTRVTIVRPGQTRTRHERSEQRASQLTTVGDAH